MANLTLVYGMRLLPSEDVAEVGHAPVKLTNGHEAHVTMHVLEGSKEEIEKTVAHQPGSVLRSVPGDLTIFTISSGAR